MKGRYCLANLVFFCDSVMSLVDEGKAVVLSVCTSVKLDTISHSILLEKLAALGLYRHIVHWVTNLPWFPSPESGSEWDCIHLDGVPSVGANPVLYFYHNLDGGIECTLSQFANDSKLGENVGPLEGRKALQRNVDSLDVWTKAKGVRFNKAKCWVLPLGQNNPCSATDWGRAAAWWKRTLGCR
ncbi:hypothetical protein DUI87_05121 [Hirundo rustica rustica]|uniref:Reverse transcriptase domain-containing protein n=1 Tax=Hirundo rustica rustica TaxID=333673 RepID=A0A3M0KY60_HIRRU|nr:hypothetical protein DUI87_05121 [Hirundo rustica rustica]